MIRFAWTIFLGAFLLFGIQPMMGKYVLPWFGGAPAVWCTCMLFFQALLLAGYAYAHWLLGRSARRGVWLHLVLLGGSVVLLGVLSFAWPTPIMPSAAWKPPDASQPILRILAVLLISIGLPYLLLSSTGPLLQGWFSRTHPGRSPYRLYSLSNVGSLLALLSYPFLVEPLLRLRQQGWIWVVGYVLYVGGAAICAWRARGLEPPAPSTEDGDEPAPGWGRMLSWGSLAACGSVMLLATTNQMCQEVSAVPLLWIVPLALYLLSFIICFDNERWYVRGVWHPLLILSLAGMCVMMATDDEVRIVVQIANLAVVLFICCMVCHGELVKLKPAPRHLTSFYLMVAAGGAAGGLLVGVAAPLVLPAFFEYHIGLIAVGWLIAAVRWMDWDSSFHRGDPRMAFGSLALAVLVPGYLLAPKAMSKLITFFSWMEWDGLVSSWEVIYYATLGLVAVILMAVVQGRVRDSWLSPYRLWWTRFFPVFALMAMVWVLGGTARRFMAYSIIVKRNFYGVVRIKEINIGKEAHPADLLLHGQTKHGIQFTDPERRFWPTSYYARVSGVGKAIMEHPRRDLMVPRQQMRIGMVGLGVGTIACFARKGDAVRFYEINQLVYDLSAGPRSRFTYFGGSLGDNEVVMGDARVSLERELAEGHPQRYDVLAIDAFSSDSIPVHLITLEAARVYLQHLRDEDSVLAFHISNRYLDLEPVVRGIARELNLTMQIEPSSKDRDTGVYYARWILLRRNTSGAGFDDPGEVQLWTDDFSNLYAVLKTEE